MDNELTELDRQYGFDTWRHIWNLQRLVGHCATLFAHTRSDNERDLEEMQLANQQAGLHYEHTVVPSEMTALDMLSLCIRYTFYERAGISQEFQVVQGTPIDSDQHINVSRITGSTYLALNAYISSLPEEQQTVYSVYNHINKHFILRMLTHDQSKLNVAEAEHFTKYTPMLKKVEFGSDDYKACLEGLKPALDNHYAHNRHHPEHYEQGINDMTWFDVCEMACDWCASSMRTLNGDPHKSVDMCKERFGMDDHLTRIMHNTMNTLQIERDRPQSDYLMQQSI
jgi:hypothetical protein